MKDIVMVKMEMMMLCWSTPRHSIQEGWETTLSGHNGNSDDRNFSATNQLTG